MKLKRKTNNTTAHWKPILFEGMPLSYECSNCGHNEFMRKDACPKCKAKMEDTNG